MKKQTIKLNESQLRKIVKESVKNVLKENIEDTVEDEIDPYDLENELYDAYKEMERVMMEIQKLHYKLECQRHTPTARGMYDSYAGKYGDEAISMLRSAYNKAANLLPNEDE